jgi:hypothetical protein
VRGHPKIFVGSSTEGVKVAREIRALVQKETNVEFVPWTRVFEPGATNIESLEKAAEEVDFAILVITQDDITISRDETKPSPRDNVIFELGLFMGSLGRERCLVVKEESPDLKLPTDLLSVGFLPFRLCKDRDLSASLDECSLDIVKRVEALKTRPHLPKNVMIAQAAHREFCQSVEGAWWERIPVREICEVTFFQVESVPIYNIVSLSGKTYDRNGEHVANWKSLLARVDGEKRQILYHWEGRYTAPDRANLMFNGFGEMNFDLPVNSQSRITRGEGKFWDVDEMHPENTEVRSTELHRAADDGTAATMMGGTSEQIRSLVIETLSRW